MSPVSLKRYIVYSSVFLIWKTNPPCVPRSFLSHASSSIQIAPYVNSVVTGAYWDQRYPRLMTNEDLAQFQRLQKQGSIDKGKMMSLVDIVCDPRVCITFSKDTQTYIMSNNGIQGAFECLSRTTNIEDGFYYYDAIKDIEHQK